MGPIIYKNQSSIFFVEPYNSTGPRKINLAIGKYIYMLNRYLVTRRCQQMILHSDFRGSAMYLILSLLSCSVLFFKLSFCWAVIQLEAQGPNILRRQAQTP